MTSFREACLAVRAVDAQSATAANARHARLTKPPGSLGRLEDLGAQLAAIAGRVPPPVPARVTVAVFAADHGVVAEGVTMWPQEVTAQMVANFAAGGAAINVLARQVGADVVVVDVGVAGDIPGAAPGVRALRVRNGTRNLAVGPAMTPEEVVQALDAGALVAAEAVAAGAQLLVTGDMGIGNTTASAALIAALTGRSPEEVTGPGAGADSVTLARKVAAIRRGLGRLPPDPEPLGVLAEVGGLEIAALAGFVVGAAAAGVPVLLDGVIAAAASLVAVATVPAVGAYLVAGHRSTEPGAGVALSHLGLQPLLDLGLRLGEGSGAVLAVPLVQAAARVLGEMATFDDAGVTG